MPRLVCYFPGLNLLDEIGPSAGCWAGARPRWFVSSKPSDCLSVYSVPRKNGKSDGWGCTCDDEKNRREHVLGVN